MKDFKLGKLPVKNDKRTFKLAKYIKKLDSPPLAVNYLMTRLKPWPMYANDRIGCCTATSACHSIINWTDDVGKAFEPHVDDVIQAYSAVSGYDPQTGVNDNGAIMLDVLNYWRKTGIAQHPIYAFVKIDTKNKNEVKQAINLFGSIYVGLSLPISAEKQIGKIWTVPNLMSRMFGNGRIGSWGGHAVAIGAYSKNYLTCVTWGELQYMTWGFFNYYADEAYAILSTDWISDTGKSGSGFDLSKLENDLNSL